MMQARTKTMCWFGAGAIMLAALLAAIGARPGVQTSGDSVEFTSEEIARILQHSPLSDPPVDPTNRFSADPAAARFGQRLFFETRFSADNSISCATCHDPAKGFADARPLARGLRGTTVNRHAMALWNVAHNRWFFWDGRADSLWSQALVPIEREDEHGGDRMHCAQVIFNDGELRQAYERIFGPLPNLSDRARFPLHARPLPERPDDPMHQAWMAMAQADRDAINEIFANIGKAIAAYEMKIINRDSPFDRFVEGLRENDAKKMQAIDGAAKRGLKIFIGRGNCRLCHTGPNFTDGEFHSVGVAPLGGGEPTDSGRYAGVEQLKINPFHAAGELSDDRKGAAAQRLTFLMNKPDNWGQFKTPSLRNVALTAPYMHQGQLPTLRDVIEHYSTLRDAAQIGHHREKILQPLNLTEQEMDDLEAFLRSLTGAPLRKELLEPPPSQAFGDR